MLLLNFHLKISINSFLKKKRNIEVTVYSKNYTYSFESMTIFKLKDHRFRTEEEVVPNMNLE